MPAKYFGTSFQNIAEFSSFYITTPGTYGCNHLISSENLCDGLPSHKAEILSSNAANNDPAFPHRGYPTIQLYKTLGAFKTPCRISFALSLDIVLGVHSTDDWFSPLTFTDDETDAWDNVITLALGPTGYLSWFHVPTTGLGQYIYQASAAAGGPKFPMRKWVNLEIEADYTAPVGYVKCWQDGKLVSHAPVTGRLPRISQIHAGLYASASVPSGIVYNGKFEIWEGMKSPHSQSENGRLAINSWR
jgi:hypothetical protein